MARKITAQDRADALKELKKLCRKGTRVYTVLRHVSASGMSRRIDLYVIKNNEPRFISGYVGNLLGYNRHPRKDGLTVGGCGMDMGYHLVHSLSYALHKDGYALNHSWL